MRKGTHHTMETRRKLSKAHFGNHYPKISEAKKRLFANGTRVIWNKGKKGIYSEATRKKMSILRKGKPTWNKGKVGIYSEDTKRKMSAAHYGKHQTEATKKKLSEIAKRQFAEGKLHIWNEGKHLSKKHRMKLSEAIKEDKSYRWKGDSVLYWGLHKWVRKHKPKPQFCELCGLRPPTEVANISGEYPRNIEDYLWSCHKCHMAFDKLQRRLNPERKKCSWKKIPLATGGAMPFIDIPTQ